MTPKDRAADLRLQREYGITLAEYNTVLKHQKGVCAICKKPPIRSRLAVEHCHRSGRLRGLACWHCNRALAGYKDDVTLLLSAANYLMYNPFEAALGIRFTAPGSVGSKKRAKLLAKLRKDGGK